MSSTSPRTSVRARRWHGLASENPDRAVAAREGGSGIRVGEFAAHEYRLAVVEGRMIAECRDRGHAARQGLRPGAARGDEQDDRGAGWAAKIALHGHETFRGGWWSLARTRGCWGHPHQDAARGMPPWLSADYAAAAVCVKGFPRILSGTGGDPGVAHAPVTGPRGRACDGARDRLSPDVLRANMRRHGHHSVTAHEDVEPGRGEGTGPPILRPVDHQPPGVHPPRAAARHRDERHPRRRQRVSRAAGGHDDRRHVSRRRDQHGGAAALQGQHPGGELRPDGRIHRRVGRGGRDLHAARRS